MENREDQFLKKAFENFDPGVEVSQGFNQHVIQKLNTQPNLGMQMLHRMRVIGPMLFVFLVAGILFLVFKGNLLTAGIIKYIPVLRPWHIFMAFIIIYFHFVRSVLILAFLYFKKRFHSSGFLAI